MQHGGCCGFAAALMGLFVHNSKEVDALYATISRAALYRGIEKSGAVKGRLEKRLAAGLLSDTAPNYLDARLSIGLMILLKEYLRETGKEDVWEACCEYSSLFQGWQYGGKLKELPKIEEGAGTYPFSYKHGDLALTYYALRWLFTMVGFESLEGRSLISNEAVAAKKGMLPTLRANSELKESLKTVIGWVNGGTYAGGIIGVAKDLFIGQDVHEPYEYISHWVYLPKQTERLDDVWQTKVWTWGAVWTLEALLNHDRIYVPKIAVVFKKPGAGAPFV